MLVVKIKCSFSQRLFFRPTLGKLTIIYTMRKGNTDSHLSSTQS